MPVVCGGFLYRFWAIYNRNSNVAEGGSAMEKIEGEYPKRVLAAFLAALLIGCGSQPVVRESVPATTAPMPTPAPAAKPGGILILIRLPLIIGEWQRKLRQNS